ncbi:MAG TPA: Rpp14/Pop5 family protein [archaeon]|nr:Rpp14/Pop5 family protein [archaeon]
MKIIKSKKTTIPAAHRDKKRYVLFEVLNADLNEKDFYFGFWIELLSFFGSKGLAEINPKIVLFKSNKAIVKCKRGKEVELIAGTAFIEKIRNKKVIINPLLTSGTIKTIKEFAGFDTTKRVESEIKEKKDKNEKLEEKQEKLKKEKK